MKYVHEYIDAEGKTHFDELDADIPLGMDVPQEYRLMLALPSNARRLAELIKEHDDGTERVDVMVACPGNDSDTVDTFEKARLVVRELIFDNPAGVFGGFRKAGMVDYINAKVVELYRDLSRKVMDRAEELSQAGDSLGKALMKANHEVLRTTNLPGILATMSNHPLWKRLSWIYGTEPLPVFCIVGELVDPTWFVHDQDPTRTGFFRARCGVLNPSDPNTQPIWVYLSTSFVTACKKLSASMDEIDKPEMFFARYALRWVQHYLKEGYDSSEAFFGGVWRHNRKLANYIFLSWMEVMHEKPPQPLDEEKFFGEKSVAKLSYSAAVA